MAIYQRIFSSPDVLQVRLEIKRAILAMERANARARSRGLAEPFPRRSIAELEQIAERHARSLDSLARSTAAAATKAIKDNIDATRVRPGTGKRPRLRELIFCRPLIPGTGTVGVARESTLDRAVNPFTPGYGPYWRAQEYGTGADSPFGAIPSQVGRRLQGYFYGPGGRGPGVRPAAQYRGGGGPHPIFIPSSARAGARGGKGGPGRVSVEITGRHFIRDGADGALGSWRQGMKSIERRTSRDIARVTTPLVGQRPRRS